GTLTQTQIQSVSSQLAQWPYTVPINLPPPAPSGGGGLTSDQAAQLTDIQTKVADIPGLVDASNFISSTVNTILGKVNQIKADPTQLRANGVAGVQSVIDAVTATITNAGGALQKTIGALFSSPTLDQLSPDSLGSACAPAVIEQTLQDLVAYGLQMQCTSYADWYVFTGNADDYTTQALGTLQIFRGGNEVLRLGLHTLTHTVYPLPGVPELPINVGLAIVPGQYLIRLTPAPETCWHLEALVQP